MEEVAGSNPAWSTKTLEIMSRFLESRSTSTGCGGFVALFYIFWGVSYIVNLIKFIGCDFAEPWKEEIIHGLGVFMAIPSLVTAWI